LLDPPPRTQPVQSADILAKWPEFIGTFKQRRISLGLTLEGTRILGVNGSVVRLGCPDDFSLSSVKRYKRELQEVYGGLLSRNLQIEPELAAADLPAEVRTEPAEKPESLDEHPVVRAMIRDLGAEPM
jgi:hypothetical protein